MDPVAQQQQTADMANRSNEAAATARRDRITENKQWRRDLDGILQQIKGARTKSRNRSLAVTHLEDTIMRLGMDLKECAEPDPYPNSKNPENTIVDPTADGLKL